MSALTGTKPTIEESQIRVTAWLPAHVMGSCSNCHSRGPVKEIALSSLRIRLCTHCLSGLKRALK